VSPCPFALRVALLISLSLWLSLARYFTDSLTGNIVTYAYDQVHLTFVSLPSSLVANFCSSQATLSLSRRCMFAVGPAPHGAPDGLCLDSQDHIWSARWQNGRLLHYNPAGEVVDIIEFPRCWNITSCIFGGKLHCSGTTEVN
jgi:sugar lactone lactonase YvrE